MIIALEGAGEAGRIDLLSRFEKVVTGHSDGADGHFVHHSEVRELLGYAHAQYGDARWAYSFMRAVENYATRSSPSQLAMSAMVVTVWSGLENVMAEIYRRHLLRFPSQLAGGNVAMKAVLDASDMDELLQRVAELKVRDFVYRSLTDQLKWFAGQLGGAYDSTGPHWDAIFELKARRDAIVHSGMKANRDYVDALTRRGMATTLSDPFVSNADYLHARADHVAFVAIQMCLDSKDWWAQPADWHVLEFLQMVQADAVIGRMWSTMETVAHAIHVVMARMEEFDSSDAIADVAYINLALAQRAFGRLSPRVVTALDEIARRPGIDPLTRVCALASVSNLEATAALHDLVCGEGVYFAYLLDWPAFHGVIDREALRAMMADRGFSRTTSKLRVSTSDD